MLLTALYPALLISGSGWLLVVLPVALLLLALVVFTGGIPEDWVAKARLCYSGPPRLPAYYHKWSARSTAQERAHPKFVPNVVPGEIRR